MVPKSDSRDVPAPETEAIVMAAGERVALSLWRNLPEGQLAPAGRHDWESVGFVVSGRAWLQMDGRTIHLRKGDSWVVPAGTEHAYIVQEPFTAIEASCPPAEQEAQNAAKGDRGVDDVSDDETTPPQPKW